MLPEPGSDEDKTALETVLEGEGWRAARDGEEGVFPWLCVKEEAKAGTQDLSLHNLSSKALGCPLGSRTPNLSKLQIWTAVAYGGQGTLKRGRRRIQKWGERGWKRGNGGICSTSNRRQRPRMSWVSGREPRVFIIL